VVKETGVTFPVALDKGLELYNQVGVVATPSTLVMDSSGKITYEVSSFLSATGDMLKETVEVGLGVRTPTVATAAVEDTSYKPNRSAMLYFNLGRNLLKMGSREKAMDKLAQAVGADAKYAAPRVLLGHLYLDLAARDAKAAEEAVRLFGEALAADPKSVSALSGMGEALLRTGKLDDSEARFGEAIKLDATYTPALTGMAAVLSKKGKYDEGLAKFKEALDLNPLNPEVYMKRATAWEAQGKAKEAAGDLRRAVELLLGLGLKSGDV
jgi:tetratricopeptide (TPR) repeat protein